MGCIDGGGAARRGAARRGAARGGGRRCVCVRGPQDAGAGVEEVREGGCWESA